MLALAMVGWVVLPVASMPVAIAKSSQQSASAEMLLDLTRWPTRNYLPPIATINPKKEALLEEALAQLGGSDELEVVSLASVTTPVLSTKPAIERLDTPVDVLSESDKNRQEQQHQVEETDLDLLWDATVERNPVIRFSLEKLATPDDLAQQQSSIFMRKTLGVLISGATLASTMLPGAAGLGSYRNMGVMAGGDALRNLTSGKNPANAQRLSATEKIQLAGMIDDLQREVIQAYHDYRRTLTSLTVAHQQATEANDLYSHQMAVVRDMPPIGGKNGESVAAMQAAMLMSQGAAFHQAHLQEMRLKQEAKRYRLQLERLAGVDAVTELHLTPEGMTANMAADKLAANQEVLIESEAIVANDDLTSEGGITP